jgi:hypothetical protein
VVNKRSERVMAKGGGGFGCAQAEGQCTGASRDQKEKHLSRTKCTSIRESRDLPGHAPTAVWFKYMGC